MAEDLNSLKKLENSCNFCMRHMQSHILQMVALIIHAIHHVTTAL